MGYTLKGWGTICKGGIHIARMGYTLQRWGTISKGGVHFARVGYTFKESSLSEPYRFHSKMEAAE